MGWVETNSSFPFVCETPDFSEYFEYKPKPGFI
jgi:hypothetical protein